MRGRDDELRARGVGLVFVGSGTPAMARGFADEHAGGHPVRTDPELRAFAAAGMRRGLRTVLRFGMVRNLVRALRAGHRQGRVQGDAWQQGGVVALAADGRVLHRQRDDVAGAPLDLDALLAALPAPA
ncbi:MAG: peroxiredoxin-like family protein [Planctomycetota bacterium]